MERISQVRTTSALQQGRAVWDQGFRGERMLPLNSFCTPVDRGLPWVDVFPEGSQNFGAGTFKCGDLEKEASAVGFSVNFSVDGVLTSVFFVAILIANLLFEIWACYVAIRKIG
jgi:hypothetical protein